MKEEKYLIALGNFENAYINYTKGSKSHLIFRTDIESYVKELKEQLRRKEDVINKAIHRIQLIQMDGEVTIRDLTELVNILKGVDKE